jgi:hypothetical protein
MSEFFRKPLSELRIDDIRSLIDDQYPEGATFEYKGYLPSKKNEKDKWYEGGDLGQRARNELLTEIVAFANSFGGYLILGVTEHSSNRHRPAGIAPIPKCEDLAYRLRLHARDCIDPSIPLIDTVGIPTESDAAGVIVVHVERSYLSPHRLISNHKCYMRRADRTEVMTMREVQDLTLRAASGSTALDSLFFERSKSFSQWMTDQKFRSGIRVSFSPVWPLRETRIYGNRNLFPHCENVKARSGSKEVEIQIPLNIDNGRPVVRGAMRYRTTPTMMIEQLLADAGWGEIRILHHARGKTRVSLFPTWILSGLYNSLRMIESYRVGVGAPTAEYALEWEICDSRREFVLGQWVPGADEESIGNAFCR